jgi:hypothetical protein
MSLKVTKIDVWSGEIQDQPGGLSGVLRQLAEANAVSRWSWPAASQTDRVPGSSFLPR